jgi:hypothetical protein
VLHTFALAYLIGAIAIWLVGIETKGKVLEDTAEVDGAAEPSFAVPAAR